MNKIELYFKKRARARRIKRLKNSIAPYLKKDFGVELNYKLWTTKGARFSASRRNKIQHELSSRTLAYLSAYLIIIGLLSAYEIKISGFDYEKYVAFITTSIAILILVFTHFETSKEYAIKSEKLHQCSLEVGELYNELRMIKTFDTIQNKEDRISRVSKKYEKILQKYENHTSIDFDMFTTAKSDYFKLSWFDIKLIKIEFYILVKLKYHIFMYFPLLFIIYIIIKSLFN
ncbi:SLATT domain-containing protein [Flavobacterium arcticum]|uniref:SLATT domain-containing protein n=1 Tax=Flavobacterium arcticum TaxID=1784713 RepID=A0A345HBY2_9FLAO|nr:SLATT domain-containing protein [Flavobacterium arcticum]AXG74092.1 SLATT domain-containing protein [Flavobacterium arcticum]KAF2507349.1 SLATT domain-containing protein [Flavobacterium arcticum]